MRFITAIVAAAVAAVASAQTPYFPFSPEGACVAACTSTVGKTFFALYDDVDETGPFFLTSLAYTYERGSPTTIQFMTQAGTCMTPCPTAELDLYRAQYPLKLKWYQANKSASLRRRSNE
ncbi:hypothetical protein BGW38_003462 [Lunasporangiospora selenospora]|uniref:Uncharacterized protein n=1 Tax=Lunasporangiospora selenospora TaxID=979761 RepID=A0A9P6KCP4_9FUNG|nr:hypothetical protein BGW38_003462 [Lunasporangiospora selenospora]